MNEENKIIDTQQLADLIKKEIDFACAGDLIEIASMFGWEYEMCRPDEFELQPEE